jgi:hypothetical protein
VVDKSEKFNWLVRSGFAARGIVYGLLGYIALSTGGEAKDGASAVYDYLQDVPLGNVILWLMVFGLLAYAAFRFLSAIADVQHKGSDTKGMARRTGDFASGIAHLLLTYAAYQFATGTKQSSQGESGSQEMAGSVLSMDLGTLVIGAIGLGFLIGGLMQLKTAWNASFMKRISSSAPPGVKTVGQIGIAARAVVFLVIGWSMVKGAWFTSEEQVKGLGEAILSLRDTGLLYTLVALGLILFGLFNFVMARYRIIPDLGPQGIKPKLRS